MPYSPGTQYEGHRYLYAGLASLGQAFGSALRERDARKYQEGLVAKERKQQDVDLAADEAKKAKATRTFLSMWMPEAKDKFEAMGLAELEGTVRALGAKQADQDRALRAETVALNNAAVREAAARRTREAEATRGFLSDLAAFQDLATASPEGEPALALSPEVRQQLKRPGGLGLAALARNPGVPQDLAERVVLGSLAQPKNVGEWNLRPGQVIDFGDGSRGLAATPNSVVVKGPPKPTTAKPLPATQQRRLDALRARRATLVIQQREAGRELDRGNKRPGPDWGWFGKPYKEQAADVQSQLDEIDTEIAQITAGQPAANAATPDAPAPKPGTESDRPANADQEARDAEEAIRRGADPKAVARRYKERTGKDLF